jgi:hypothetical protein
MESEIPMVTQSIIVLLAAWGAIISTILLIAHLRDRSYNLRRQLEIFAYTDAACQNFFIDVTNMGPHPIDITRISVSYGVKPYIQLIKNWTENMPVELKDGDQFSLTIPRTDFALLATETEFKQKYTQRLWLGVYGSDSDREKPLFTFKVELAPFIALGQHLCSFSIQHPG